MPGGGRGRARDRLPAHRHRARLRQRGARSGGGSPPPASRGTSSSSRRRSGARSTRPTICGARPRTRCRTSRSSGLDLLLLHWPNPDFPLEETLGALIGLRDDGLIKHLGVSNFPAPMLREALGVAPIFTDQVEFHPFLGQDALVDLAAEKDFMVTAYSPLARGKVPKDETLRKIGEAHGKTAGQVALRWLLDKPQVCHDPEGLEPRAPGRELRGLRLRAERRGAGRDRRAAQGRAHHRPRAGRPTGTPRRASAWRSGRRPRSPR